MMNQFDDVARVVSGSRLARAIDRGLRIVRAAATTSVAVTLLTRGLRHIAAASATEQIRLAGVWLLVAATTHALLRGIVPPLVRPAAPLGLYAVIAAGALALIAAAPLIARAWPGSSLRRLFRIAAAD